MNPIIVVGMHRSGTSLVTRILKNHDVFMGVNTGMHDESPLFLKLNSWILKQTGSSWDSPENINLLSRENTLVQMFVKFIVLTLKSPIVIKYTGLRHFIPFLKNSKLSTNWGWKDPLNSITLDIWKLIYPNAKIIVIKRHGVDVANSLVTRGRKFEKSSEERFVSNKIYRIYSLYRQLINPVDRSRAFNDSILCKDIEKGIELWSFYNDAIEKSLKNFPKQNVLRLSYEELLEKPQLGLSALAEFCEFKQKTRSTEKLKSNRAFNYKRNPELIILAKKYNAALSRHGY